MKNLHCGQDGNVLSFIIKKRGPAKCKRYYVKYHTRREMKNTEVIAIKNGRPANQEICRQTYGARIFRIGES